MGEVNVIVTGFGKFGKIEQNPTTQLIQRLGDDPNIKECFVLEVSSVGVQEGLAVHWQSAKVM